MIAEQEFLSSTSPEVCELWSGREIVRATGKPSDTNNMKTLVVSVKLSSVPGTKVPSHSFSRLDDAASAYKDGNLFQNVTGVADKIADEFASEAPNLTLNVPDVLLNEKTLWYLTFLVALPIQLITLTMPALATYYWKWPRKGVPVAKYAYGCFAAGTIAIFFGLVFCGRVIENSTTEVVFRPADKNDQAQIQRILTLQLGCTVGSQHFPSFAILYDPKDRLLRASRLDQERLRRYRYVLVYLFYIMCNRHAILILPSFHTAAASFFPIAGFVVQLIGLGALHWSATITMLMASLIMTGIRAWTRKGLAKDPVCVPIPEKNELGWLALRIVRNDWPIREAQNKPDRGWGLLTRFITPQPKAARKVQSKRDCDWCIPTGFIAPISMDGTSICYPGHEGMPGIGKKELNKDSVEYVRQLSLFSSRGQDPVHQFQMGFHSIDSASLPQQCPEVKAATDLILRAPDILSFCNCADVASNLADAMEGIVRIMWDRGPDESPWKKKSWVIDVQQSLGLKTPWVVHLDSETLRRDLTAGLSLWVYSLICGSDWLGTHLGDDDRFSPQNRPRNSKLTPGKPEKFIRILGHSGYLSALAMRRWIKILLRLHLEEPVKTYREIPAYDGEWHDESHTHWVDLRSWPVFGLYNSAIFDNDSSG